MATLTWLNEICEAQKGLALNVDPVITIQKLKEERKSVISFCKPIVNTPKPIPVVEKKEEEEEEEEDIDTSNTGTAEGTAEGTSESTAEGINAESTAEGKSDPMDVDEPEVDLSGKDADGDTNMNDAA